MIRSPPSDLDAVTDELDAVTEPTSTPASGPGAPSLSPATSAEHGLDADTAARRSRPRRSDERSRASPSMMATIETIPIFSSAQASERVRGMSASSRKKSPRYESFDARSSLALPSNSTRPSFSMMNSASSHFCASAGVMSEPCCRREPPRAWRRRTRPATGGSR